MKCGKCHKIKRDTAKWYENLFYPMSHFCYGHRTYKASQLEPILRPNGDDVFIIADMSEHKTKKITMDQLCEFLKTRL